MLTIGRHFPRHAVGDTGRPIVQIGDLDNPRSSRRRFEGDLPQRFEVRPGDLLITQLQPLRVRRWSGDRSWLGPRLVKFDPNPERFDPRFAFYVLSLRLPDLEHQLQGTTIPHLGATALAELQVPTPPLAVQRELSEELDRATHLTEQLVTAVGEIRGLGAERLATVTEELAFSADDSLVRLKFLFGAASTTVAMQPAKELLFDETGGRLIPASEAGGERGGDLPKARAVAAGDVVVRRHASGALEAAVAGEAGCVSSHLPVLIPRPGANPDFFAHVLRSRRVWGQISARAEDRQRFLGLSHLLDLRVPFPAEPEQARRTASLDHEFALTAEVRRAAGRTEELLRNWTQRRMTDLLSS